MFVRQINLDFRTDRWEECTRNHAEMGFSPQDIPRFSACRDSFGSIGCAKSHISLLSEFYTATREEFALILEDDFDFAVSKQEFQAKLRSVQDSGLEWDMLMLAGGNVTVFESGFDFIKKVFEAHTTSGYIIRRHYVPTLMSCFAEAARELERFRSFKPVLVIQDRFSIDQVWKRLQRTDKWYLFTPRLGVQRPSFSDIENKFVDHTPAFAL